MHDTDEPTDWLTLVAVGLVVDDLSVDAIARYAGVPREAAAQAVALARSSGLVADDGTVDATTRHRLIVDLPADLTARVHAAAARQLLAEGPDRLLDALAHVRQAGSHIDPDEVVALADHGARMSLALNDYRVAHDLLVVAAEFDHSEDLMTRGQRLCALAEAADGLGDVTGARRHLAQAVAFGELAGDATLVASAAVQHALPTDWYAGDLRAIGLLQRAEQLDLTQADRACVLAARALTEARIPVIEPDGQQLAWVTRPAVSRSLAIEAMNAARGQGEAAECLALVAWRATHRAPAFLAQRREASRAIVTKAQRLRHISHQIDGAVWQAVDALESGDRPQVDEALAVVRWVAERDRNPRHLWRADTLAAGVAFLDGDIDQARRLRERAGEEGRRMRHPGWLAAELLLVGQELVAVDDPETMVEFRFDEGDPAYASPLGRACVAYLYARTGEPGTAAQYARHSLRQLEDESSYLFTATRIAAVAVAVGDGELARDVAAVLAPWEDHVAVDANGWWCDGPVALWLAALHAVTHEHGATRRLLDVATPLARSINDVRSVHRAEQLAATLDPAEQADGTGKPLTAREREVLRRLRHGLTNPAIADELGYSVSTIRNDTVSIYRKLGVRNRSEASALAATMHLP